MDAFTAGVTVKKYNFWGLCNHNYLIFCLIHFFVFSPLHFMWSLQMILGFNFLFGTCSKPVYQLIMKIKNDINKWSHKYAVIVACTMGDSCTFCWAAHTNKMLKFGNQSMTGYDLMLFQQTFIQAGQFFWVTTLYMHSKHLLETDSGLRTILFLACCKASRLFVMHWRELCGVPHKQPINGWWPVSQALILDVSHENETCSCVCVVVDLS